MLFVIVSVATQWVRSHFGALGIDALAAVVGFTDIDPFVLSIAQGSAGAMPLHEASVAILVAISSNNVLKALYAVIFAGWRASLPAAASLGGLAACGILAGFFI